MKIKTNKIYLIILIFSYLRMYIDAHYSNLGQLFTLIGYVIIMIAIFIGIKYSMYGSNEILVLFLFLLSQLCGYFYSTNTSYPNNKWYLAIIWALSFVVFVMMPRKIAIERKDIEHILFLNIIVAGISAVYAMLFQLNSNIFSFRDASQFNITNAYASLWGHRNQFAIILLGGIVSTGYFISQNIYKRFNKFLLCFLTANLALTLSRTCYVALFTYVFTYLLCEWKIHKKQVMALFVLGLSIASLYFFMPRVKNIVDIYMIRGSSGLTGRDTLWRMATQLLDNPTLIFGRGLGIDRLVLKGDTIGAGISFHNMYLTYLVSGGIILLSIIIILFLKTFLMFRKQYAVRDRALFDWAVAGMFAFLVYPMFEVSSFFGMNYASIIQTFFVFTIPMMLVNCSRKEKESEINETCFSRNSA